VNFDLWPFQEEMVGKFDLNRFVICKMPRQVGKTTTVASYLLWKILFTPDYNVAILANKDRQAREILSRVQLMFEHLPKWLQMGVVEWNKGNIELENGSKILASATSSSAIRGGSFNLVYLDEFAFVPTNIQEDFFASVYPTISSGQTSKVLITSTPNGMNLFYKLWVDSVEGRNFYERVDVHWSQIPGRDDKWRQETISNTSEDQFRQEYECLDGETEIEIFENNTTKKVAIKNIINTIEC
jgi:phage terminase large subunit GpA-like protein